MRPAAGKRGPEPPFSRSDLQSQPCLSLNDDFKVVQGTVFVFKCMHPASCELGDSKGNEMAGPVGAWAGEQGSLPLRG